MTIAIARLRWWGDRWLLSLAVLFGFVGLAFAAADHLAVAGQAALIALGFLACSVIVVTYRRLPADSKVAVLSRRFIGTSAAVSAAAAVIVSSLIWFAGWTPKVRLPEILLRNYEKLDFIPSVFSLLLPVSWRSGFHQYFSPGTYCFPGPFWWETMRYLRTSIPAYAVVFFGTICAFRFVSTVVKAQANSR